MAESPSLLPNIYQGGMELPHSGWPFVRFFFQGMCQRFVCVIVRKKNTMENNLEKSDVLNWLGSITSSPLTDVHISGEQSSDCHDHI